MSEEADMAGAAFNLGLIQGLALTQSMRCQCACSCDTTTRVMSAPTALDFGEQVRSYLERYELVDDDEIVEKVEVLPNEVVAHVRK